MPETSTVPGAAKVEWLGLCPTAACEQAQARFDQGGWERELHPLWNYPCGTDEEASKAWEALRFLYFSRSLSPMLWTLAEHRELLGYDDDSRHLAHVAFLADPDFPSQSWSASSEGKRWLRARWFNDALRFTNLMPLRLLHPLDSRVKKWISEAQADHDKATSENSGFANYCLKNDAYSHQTAGDNRRVILDIDLASDDLALTDAFKELLVQFRGSRKKGKRGPKTSAHNFFKALVMHYRLLLDPTMKKEVAAQGLWGEHDKPEKRRCNHAAAIRAYREVTVYFEGLKAHLEEEWRLLQNSEMFRELPVK